jgi:hypothetical protein
MRIFVEASSSNVSKPKKTNSDGWFEEAERRLDQLFAFRREMSARQSQTHNPQPSSRSVLEGRNRRDSATNRERKAQTRRAPKQMVSKGPQGEQGRKHERRVERRKEKARRRSDARYHIVGIA